MYLAVSRISENFCSAIVILSFSSLNFKRLIVSTKNVTDVDKTLGCRAHVVNFDEF